MTNRMDSAAALTPRRRKSQLHWQLLLMVLPALIYLLIFHYKPMYGVVIAFKNYNINSSWASWAAPGAGWRIFSGCSAPTGSRSF